MEEKPFGDELPDTRRALFLSSSRALSNLLCWMDQLPFLLAHDQMMDLRIHREGSVIRTMIPSGPCTYSSPIVQSQGREKSPEKQGLLAGYPSIISSVPPTCPHTPLIS